ncbi:MAG: hypothetical protein WCS73_10815 [Lentisphaeria bacterium]
MKHFITTILVFLITSSVFAVTAEKNKAVTDFLGDGWQFVSTRLKQSSTEIVTTDDGKALKISAAPQSWTIVLNQAQGLTKGETIEMEIVLKGSSSNIASVISSGFVWGTGNPGVEGNKLAKQLVNGNDQWQTIRYSLQINKQPVTLGIGLEKRQYPTSILIKSIKITKGKEILQKRLTRALAIKINKKLPNELQKYMQVSQKELCALQTKLADATGTELINLTQKLNQSFENLERIHIVADGKLNPEIIKIDKDSVNIYLYNTAFTHSVWYRIIHQKNIKLSYNIDSKLYPINHSNLILVPANEPVMLNIKATTGEHDIILQPLDFLMEKPVKHFFKILRQ